MLTTLSVMHVNVYFAYNEQHFKCAVKTTADMRLDKVEVRVCAYVFQENFDSRLVFITLKPTLWVINFML